MGGATGNIDFTMSLGCGGAVAQQPLICNALCSLGGGCGITKPLVLLCLGSLEGPLYNKKAMIYCVWSVGRLCHKKTIDFTAAWARGGL